MKYFLLSIFLLITSGATDIKSTNGTINFDAQADGQSDMTLNNTGLGIGIAPSSNLHVNGNTIISDQLFVGGSSGASNLNINGTIGYGAQMVSSNTTLGDYSVILADTSSDNLTLTLPSASVSNGKVFNIKKTSLLNQLWVDSSDNIDSYDSRVELTSPNSGYSFTQLISNGSEWYILNQSDDLLNVIGADNLIGWWKLDETSGDAVYDSSSQSNSGELDASMSFSGNGTTGKINRALTFDGSDDKVTIPNNDSFDLGTSSITITAWVQFDSGSFGRYTVIVGRGNFDMFELNKSGADRLRLEMRFDDDSTLRARESSASLTEANRWYHVAGIFNPIDGSFDFYVDGAAQGVSYLDAQTDGTLKDSNADVYIGARNGSNLYMEGLIDDVRIYNKALTSSEVEAIYNQGQ